MQTEIRSSLVRGTALTLTLAAPLQAQERTALLVEGDPVPGLPGMTVDSLLNTRVNAAGGRAVTAEVLDSASNLVSIAFGSPNATTPDAVLFQEGLFGTCQQTSWEGNFGLAENGSVIYSASCDDTQTLAVDLDSVYLDDLLVALEGQPILGLPGKQFRFNGRPAVTAGDVPVWVGGIDDIATGANEGNGLFMGLDQTVLIRTGDTLPNVAFPLDVNAVDLDFQFSLDGTQYITLVDMQSGTSIDDGRVVVNGVGLDVGGAPVVEDSPVPAAVGGLPGESWDNFDFFGILDDGTCMFTGDTTGNADSDEFVFLGDSIVLREGDTLADGNVVTGTLESASLGSNGDLALVWDIEDGFNGDLEAVLFNGLVVAREGDAIDLDGDGSVDPNAVISGFSGFNSLSVAADQRLYVTALVDTAGTASTTDDVEVFLEIALAPFLNSSGVTEISLSAGGEQDLALFLPAEVEAEFYVVLGSTSGTMPGTPAGLLNLPLNFDAYTLFTLTNVNSPVLSPSFGVLDGLTGVATTFGVEPGQNPALAGTSFQHAYLTLSITDIIDVNFTSEAIEVTLVP